MAVIQGSPCLAHSLPRPRVHAPAHQPTFATTRSPSTSGRWLLLRARCRRKSWPASTASRPCSPTSSCWSVVGAGRPSPHPGATMRCPAHTSRPMERAPLHRRPRRSARSAGTTQWRACVSMKTCSLFHSFFLRDRVCVHIDKYGQRDRERDREPLRRALDNGTTTTY